MGKKWLRRLRRAIVWGLVAVVVLLLGANVAIRIIGGRDLRDAVAQADASDPGWRWDELNAKKPSIPESENACLKMRELTNRLPDRDEQMKQLLDEFAEVDSPTALTADQSKAVKECLDRLPLRRADVVVLQKMPRGDWPAISADDAITGSDQWQRQRLLAAWLKLQVFASCAENQPAAALEAVKLSLDATRSGGNDVLAIHLLVCIALDRLTLSGLERALAQSERIPVESLRQTRQRITNEADRLSLAPALCRERAWMFHIMGIVSDGPAARVNELAGGKDTSISSFDPINGIWRWQIRGYLWHSQALTLEMMNRAIEIAKHPADRQFSEYQQFDHETKILRSHPDINRVWNGIGLLSIPMVTKVSEAFVRIQTELRCAQIGLALEEFRARHDRWPDTLQELEKDLNIPIPTDPYDGQPLRYKKRQDGVTIYSIGANGKDDGGNIPKKLNDWKDVDYGFRLWDPKHRRQPPPPPEADLNQLDNDK